MVRPLNINCGKLLIYFSANHERKRLRSVSAAVRKMAKKLRLDVEVIKLKETRATFYATLYIYFKDGNGEPIPLYCDKNQDSSVESICKALRGMMFLLSFHPRYSALKRIRREIMKFS